METKKELRIKHKKQREELNESKRQEWSAEICSHILGSSLYREAQVVCAYYPLRSEASLLPLLEDALLHGKTIALPRVIGDDMEFYVIESTADLAEGSFHVMEPVEEKTRPLESFEAALVLTPGVAFDMDGNRIGYGKGYYDRYFHRHREAIPMGVAYEAQLEEVFETDAGDVRMQYLVTELGIRKIETEQEGWQQIWN